MGAVVQLGTGGGSQAVVLPTAHHHNSLPLQSKSRPTPCSPRCWLALSSQLAWWASSWWFSPTNTCRWPLTVLSSPGCPRDRGAGCSTVTWLSLSLPETHVWSTMEGCRGDKWKQLCLHRPDTTSLRSQMGVSQKQAEFWSVWSRGFPHHPFCVLITVVLRNLHSFLCLVSPETRSAFCQTVQKLAGLAQGTGQWSVSRHTRPQWPCWFWNLSLSIGSSRWPCLPL